MSGDGITNFWLEHFASQKFLRDFSTRLGQEESTRNRNLTRNRNRRMSWTDYE